MGGENQAKVLSNTVVARTDLMNSIYLDHNATSPVHPEVIEAMRQCYHKYFGNASSPHSVGRRARSAIDEARDRIAEILGAQLCGTQHDRLIFTSGGTEANNLALFGITRSDGGRVITSAIEHPSIHLAADELSRRGLDVVRLPVQSSGVIWIERIDEYLMDQTQLVSVMLANNETGVLQPVSELVDRCVSAGIPVHTDAVQAIGKQSVHFRQLGVSALSMSAHKFQGPMGIGALLVKHDVDIQPLLFGGFQQLGLRPGTEPVALAVGMCKGLEIWRNQAHIIGKRMARFRDHFESLICSQITDIVIHGSDQARLPHTSNISFPGLDRQALLMALDLAGVACSTGSACASGSSEPSHVLIAMGCGKTLTDGSLRFSLGVSTTAQDIDQAALCICRVVKDLRDRS